MCEQFSTGPSGANILDGRSIAAEHIRQLEQQVKSGVSQGRAPPGLAVILVGHDPASAVYVRNKRRAAQMIGIQAFDYDLPSTTSTAELSQLIDRLNHDPKVHGILVQLPLPVAINAAPLLERIAPHKDVDGFHPYNLGRLALRQLGLRPCTPRGIMDLLAHTQEPLCGRTATIVGVSNHVGRPMGLELLLAGCTVTSCHKFTPPSVLQQAVVNADILVVAVGKPGLIPGEWIKPGAIVIDVGINRLSNGGLVGDVNFDVARQRASWITPVPGGVGPMTVAMLMQNTVDALTATD